MKLVSALLLPMLFAPFTAAQSALPANERPLARDIFKQLIEINTTDSVGNVTTAAEAVHQRLLAAGFPAADLQVLGPNDRKKNLQPRLQHLELRLVEHHCLIVA